MHHIEYRLQLSRRDALLRLDRLMSERGFNGSIRGESFVLERTRWHGMPVLCHVLRGDISEGSNGICVLTADFGLGFFLRSFLLLFLGFAIVTALQQLWKDPLDWQNLKRSAGTALVIGGIGIGFPYMNSVVLWHHRTRSRWALEELFKDVMIKD